MDPFLLGEILYSFACLGLVACVSDQMDSRGRLEVNLDTPISLGFWGLQVGKKIRQDGESPDRQDSWTSMEAYLHLRERAQITSCYCPECAAKAMEEIRRQA